MSMTNNRVKGMLIYKGHNDLGIRLDLRLRRVHDHPRRFNVILIDVHMLNVQPKGGEPGAADGYARGARQGLDRLIESNQ